MYEKNLDNIAQIVAGQRLSHHYSGPIRHVETDSRLPFRQDALFVSLNGPNYQGADFLRDARAKGARGAIVSGSGHTAEPGFDLIQVEDALSALQALARAHRSELKMPVIAVTGSNGKTILKDFLVSVLGEERAVQGSPGSYNSQVGVALSLLRLERNTELAVIEAGVSRIGEMDRHTAMIQPNFGVLTNIGMAHFEGFGSREKIAREKLALFRDLDSEGWLLAPRDPLLAKLLPRKPRFPVYYFDGQDPRLPVFVEIIPLEAGRSALTVVFPDGDRLRSVIPMDYSWQEVFGTLQAGVCAAFLMGVTPEKIMEGLSRFHPPLNRIEIWKSERGSILVNDAYSADPVSVRSCLNVFQHYPNCRKVFIFGGMKELGERTAYEHRVIGEEAARQKVDLLITVGDAARAAARAFKSRRPAGDTLDCSDSEAVIRHVSSYTAANDIIVVKGPREARFDQIVATFKARLTQTVYYIRLAKIRANLHIFRERVPADCKILVMLKAFAYGTDALHIARRLQSDVDYFGVAYVREAVQLRRHGITSPILVQLALPDELEDVVNFSLQPVVFDAETATRLAAVAKARTKTVKIHIKIDTGLGRFGVFPGEAAALARHIQTLGNLEIIGLMTHFSAADDPDGDAFTREQIRIFDQTRSSLGQIGVHPPLVHAAATAGAIRFPEAHYNMIRVGLGLYGIYPSDEVRRSVRLQCPVALVSKIGGLKRCPKDYPISYGGKYVTVGERTIALLPIGYHDGLSRRLSNAGHVIVKGKKAPIVGAVCMDFTAVDVTGIADVSIGEPVLIFGEWRGDSIRVEELAAIEGTIPYDVLCRLSDRIQRIYLLDDE